jgi:hypothetical protein
MTSTQSSVFEIEELFGALLSYLNMVEFLLLREVNRTFRRGVFSSISSLVSLSSSKYFHVSRLQKIPPQPKASSLSTTTLSAAAAPFVPSSATTFSNSDSPTSGNEVYRQVTVPEKSQDFLLQYRGLRHSLPQLMRLRQLSFEGLSVVR